MTSFLLPRIAVSLAYLDRMLRMIPYSRKQNLSSEPQTCHSQAGIQVEEK